MAPAHSENQDQDQHQHHQHHLGFVEPIEDVEHFQEVAFRSPNFNLWDGGQLGGSPSWLNPEHIPRGPLLARSSSNDDDDDAPIMNFLCQIYAPVDELAAEKDEAHDRAFHRALYVFSAPAPTPHSKPSIRVLRAQLPQRNPYYPDDPESIADDIGHWNKHIPAHIKLCSVCGLQASYICPKQEQPFCCRQHQKEYFHHVTHKHTTTNNDSVTHNSFLVESLPSLYPVSEIVVEAEEEPQDDDGGQKSNRNNNDSGSDTNDDNDEQHVETQTAEMNKISTLFPSNDHSSNNNNGDDDDANIEQEDLNRMLQGEPAHNTNKSKSSSSSISPTNDPVTQRFVERCQSNPDQVLRYCRWKGDNHETYQPLWFQSNDQPSNPPPPCPHCGAPRQFEFQIMPQVLHFLQKKAQAHQSSSATTKQDPHVEEQWKQVLQAMQDADSWIEQTPPEHIPPSLIDAKERATKQYQQAMLASTNELDFGTIAVYTCTNSCNPPDETDTATESNKERVLGAYLEEYAWVQTSSSLPTTDS